jgi:hypothetical protein
MIANEEFFEAACSVGDYYLYYSNSFYNVKSTAVSVANENIFFHSVDGYPDSAPCAKAHE